MKEYAIIALVGGSYYYFLEILWRGYSHYAMVIVGGASALLLYLINKRLDSVNLIVKCLIGAVVITIAELLGGIILNIYLKWDIWDYSRLKYNFLGQISIRTSFLWMVLCFPAFIAGDIVKEIFVLKGDNSGKKNRKTEN